MFKGEMGLNDVMFAHKLCGVRSHPYTAFIISRWGQKYLRVRLYPDPQMVFIEDIKKSAHWTF